MNSIAGGTRTLSLSQRIETMSRVAGIQIRRSNTIAASVSDCYKRTITIPLLDHPMCELDYRFDNSKTEAIFNGFVIVPAKLIAIVHQSEKGHWKEKFSLFANVIRDDLPNALSLDSELGKHTGLVIEDLYQIMYQIL